MRAKIPLAAIFEIHSIFSLNGASKNKIFPPINAQYFRAVSFCFSQINSAQSEIIKLYPTKRYGVSLLDHVKNGLRYANAKPNNKIFLDL